MQAIITVGISGSGKSTFAREYVQIATEAGIPAAEINRDNVRMSEIVPGGDWSTYEFTDENEAKVTRICFKQFCTALYDHKNMVISNTNLVSKAYKKELTILENVGCDIQFLVFNLPLGLCLERNKQRGLMAVSEAVIHQQYEKLQQWLDKTDTIKHPITILTT